VRRASVARLLDQLIKALNLTAQIIDSIGYQSRSRNLLLHVSILVVGVELLINVEQSQLAEFGFLFVSWKPFHLVDDLGKPLATARQCGFDRTEARRAASLQD